MPDPRGRRGLVLAPPAVNYTPRGSLSPVSPHGENPGSRRQRRSPFAPFSALPTFDLEPDRGRWPKPPIHKVLLYADYRHWDVGGRRAVGSGVLLEMGVEMGVEMSLDRKAHV